MALGTSGYAQFSGTYVGRADRMRWVGVSRGLIAVAAASLAILSLTYGDAAPLGRALPDWIPGREIWVYGSAGFLLAASAGICFARTALPSVLGVGAYEAVWALTGVPPDPIRSAERGMASAKR
jgi:hypothetical protein